MGLNKHESSEERVMRIALFSKKEIGPPACAGCSTCFSGTMGKTFEQFSPFVQKKFEQIRRALENISKEYGKDKIKAVEQRNLLDVYIVEIAEQTPASQQDAFSRAFFEMARAHCASDEIYEFVNGE